LLFGTALQTAPGSLRASELKRLLGENTSQSLATDSESQNSPDEILTFIPILTIVEEPGSVFVEEY
jgi:hypothetical protein